MYAGFQPPPMVQQHHLHPLVPCSSLSREGRLSSMDLEIKAEPFLQDEEQEEEEEEEQLIHTR